VELNESKFCGAAIGTEVKSVARDFKACALPVSGENMCTAGAHQGPKTVRLTTPLGSSMFLAIATPQSKQVFSRPILEGADLRFLLQGSVHYERLLTIKMEPRVWKTVLELFPGSHCLMEEGASSLADPPRPLKSETAPSYSPDKKQAVSAAPITTPQPVAGGSQFGQSFQPGDGWDFEAHESELQSDRAPNFPWEQQLGPTKLELSLSPSKSPSVLSDQPFTEQVHKLEAQVSRMEREFAARTTEAEALKQSLAGTFNAMAEQMKLINAELKRVKSDLRHAESMASPSRFVGLGSTQAVYMDPIMDRVRQELKSYATQAELQNLQQLSLPADLVGPVSTIEGELFNNAGSVPQLGE
jgi:hypothetical protein